MAMFELRTMDTAYLRNELFKEKCGCHRLEPNHLAQDDGICISQKKIKANQKPNHKRKNRNF